MIESNWRTVLVVALVVLAGCTGGLGGDAADGADGSSENVVDGDATAPSDVSVDSDDAALATFYVSDEPNQIDDFEHLNVTVTKIGLKRATNDTADGAADGEGDADDADDADGEDGEDDQDDAVGEDSDGDDSGEETDDGDAGANESDDESADDGGSAVGNASEDGWIEYDVNETTVDLTELVGPNATQLDVLALPEGEYETVFVHVSEVEGVLENGTETEVKLPSDKLQVHTTFAAQAGEEVDFVFDIGIFEAGNSGKYILKPVVSETGTGDEVEIRDVDESDDRGNAGGGGDGNDAGGDDGGDADGGADDTDGDDASDGGDGSDAADENRGNGNGNGDGGGNALLAFAHR